MRLPNWNSISRGDAHGGTTSYTHASQYYIYTIKILNVYTILKMKHYIYIYIYSSFKKKKNHVQYLNC